MHCNLTPPDVVQVILRFNCEAHDKFEIGQPLDKTTDVFTFTAYPAVYFGVGKMTPSMSSIVIGYTLALAVPEI